MGKAARRKEHRRLERTEGLKLAQSTQHQAPVQQVAVTDYNKLRYAISWADLSTASPIQPAANDDVISTPEKPPKQRKKPGPKPKPLAPEVRQAQLWALYADLWDELDAELSPRERRALQKAMQRNSGTLDDLIDDDSYSSSIVDHVDDEDAEEIDYSEFFEDHDENY